MIMNDGFHDPERFVNGAMSKLKLLRGALIQKPIAFAIKAPHFISNAAGVIFLLHISPYIRVFLSSFISRRIMARFYEGMCRTSASFPTNYHSF